MKLRNEIINKSRIESEKNENVFYADIEKMEVKNSHAKVFIKNRRDEKDQPQPVHLVDIQKNSIPFWTYYYSLSEFHLYQRSLCF
jgi:hypothetical protein